MTKEKDNRYKDLKDIKDEKGNKLDEESRIETKKKEVYDSKGKKVLQETTPSTREMVNENVKQDIKEESYNIEDISMETFQNEIEK